MESKHPLLMSSLITQGLLRKGEEPLALSIINEHGMETFAAFLIHRQPQQAQVDAGVQTEINTLMGIAPETFAKYTH